MKTQIDPVALSALGHLSRCPPQLKVRLLICFYGIAEIKLCYIHRLTEKENFKVSLVAYSFL